VNEKSATLRALFIGFGNVGREMARILTVDRDDHPGLADLDLSVVGITTATRGGLASLDGVDLERALQEAADAPQFSPDNPDRAEIESLQAARELDYDVLVELSPLSIEERGEPALSHVQAALERGLDVVTANKGPVAFAFDELRRLEREHGGSLRHESTVMDGAPVLSLAHRALAGCRVSTIEGIFNSTTNFVLTRFEEGAGLQEAVREAQRLGIAEADPRYDLEGWDSAAKTTILANAFLGAAMTPLDVDREGILSATPQEVGRARRRGARLKLVCRAWREDEGVRARVQIEEVPLTDPFAAVSGTGSILRLHTDLMGPLTITQERPSITDTAFGVLSDLLTTALDR
jgi:homoserine dehydrogenase